MKDLEYFRRRLAEELVFVQSCKDPRVRGIHAAMAAAYRKKVEAGSGNFSSLGSAAPLV